MDMDKILKSVLEKITPLKEDISRLKKISDEFISSLKKEGMKSFIGGSLAKGTLILTNEKEDVDIFVVFDSEGEIFKLEKVLNKLNFAGKLRKVHGSRDYFQIDCPDVLVEVIPVAKNKNPELAKNVTDVSLSHVKYIINGIKKNPALADEIRLAKAFCRANKVYGAESYIQGFSGYSLEVLVIYFGGFVRFLKGISKQKIIDPARHFRNAMEISRELNSSKTEGPVILVDPTHKYRNACAGLRNETFDRFLKVSTEFLKKPSKKFFEVKEIDVEEIKKLALKKKALFVEVNLETDRQKGDVAGTKMKKFFEHFVSELMRKQQKILRKEFDYQRKGQKAKGYLVLSEKKEIEIRGPSVKMVNAVASFKKAKGNKVFLKKGFWWFKEKISVEDIFKRVEKVGKEMGAWGKLV